MMDETTDLALPAEAATSLETGRFWEHVLGGVVLAVASFGVVLYSAYHGWVASDLSSDWAYAGVGFGFMFFALGAFTFAYGWCVGDMQKAIRLTFFICLVMLAVVVGLLILLKSKGIGAKAAGDVGAAATSNDDFNPLPLMRAVGSMVVDAAPAGDSVKATPDVEETLFQIKCRGCSAKFAPTPPAAKCPFCGEAALAV